MAYEENLSLGQISTCRQRSTWGSSRMFGICLANHCRRKTDPSLQCPNGTDIVTPESPNGLTTCVVSVSDRTASCHQLWAPRQ
ncbi:hypothetical protein SMAC4_13237 [Sordaria macrospora]|uniref:uncharacterized protein n=1 Tax=Sordaria macrospora TaxID=5147 RepID=UPI002B2CFD16|nr:hypothetical protein SMAC4_13237 [Sordaria macrospora]